MGAKCERAERRDTAAVATFGRQLPLWRRPYEVENAMKRPKEQVKRTWNRYSLNRQMGVWRGSEVFSRYLGCSGGWCYVGVVLKSRRNDGALIKTNAHV